MRDPTIPRHRGRGTRGLTTGRLVWKGADQLALRDRRGNSWSLASVSFHVGGWGSVSEGTEKLPRPWRYDETTGKAIVRGDLLLIDFIDGNPALPVVMSVARSTTKTTDFLAYNHEETAGKANRMRVRFTPLDSDGQQSGEVRLKVADDGEGTVELEATHEVLIEVGTNLDSPTASFRITPTEVVLEASTSIKLGANAVEKVIKGNTFQVLFNAHTHPTGVGPSGPPLVPLTGSELSTKVSTE